MHEVEKENIDAQEPHYNMDGESHCDERHVDGDQKVSCELVNPMIDLVDDGEASNKEANNMCDLVHMIVADDDLFASQFQEFKFENNKEKFSYQGFVCRV